MVFQHVSFRFALMIPKQSTRSEFRLEQCFPIQPLGSDRQSMFLLTGSWEGAKKRGLSVGSLRTGLGNAELEGHTSLRLNTNLKTILLSLSRVHLRLVEYTVVLSSVMD